MAKQMQYLVTHTTDTPFNREVTPDDIAMWHKGAFRNKDGSALFLGKKVLITDLPKLKLILPSGKIITADKTDGRGWSQVGYADLINRAGDLINLVPYTFDETIDLVEITNGQPGYNSNSRHVVFAGGWAKDGNKSGRKPNGQLYEIEELYTIKQIDQYISYLEMQRQIVNTVKIIGHNECSDKTCPNFDVQKVLKKFGII